HGAGAHVDVHVAGLDPVAVGGGEGERPDHVHMIAVHQILRARRLQAGRAVFELHLRLHVGDVDDLVGAGLLHAGASGEDEGPAGIVLAAIGDLAELQPFLGGADLVLVEQEADLLLLGERREEEKGEDHADQGREPDLEDPDQLVVCAARARPAALYDPFVIGELGHSRTQTWAKISCSAQPARSSAARYGRKSKQARASAVRPSRSRRTSSFSLSWWR